MFNEKNIFKPMENIKIRFIPDITVYILKGSVGEYQDRDKQNLNWVI